MKIKIVSIYFILVIMLIVSALASVSFGSAELSASQIFGGLLSIKGFEFEKTIIWSVRFPRLFASIISGVGLSLSGVLLQSVMGNDLASPNTIGVSSGAGLASIICLSLFPSLSFLLPIGAFLGAFLTAILILMLSKAAGGGKATVILAGIACTSLFGAGISFISLLDTDVLAEYNSFSVGGFSGVTLKALILPTILIFVSLLISLFTSGRIAALSLGDAMAAGLGINPILMRTLCLALAAMSAAAVISFAGLLGFVGLVVPHITRKIVGPEIKAQLSASPLIGAILVTLSDLFGRTAFAPSEISVGIVMAFIGAPFFFFLLLKRRNEPNA